MLKANLIKQFNYCNAIANDIIEHNKSKEIQEYAKQFAEIESPLVGGTDADWIRINWGDIYIFLYDNLSLEAAPIVRDGITYFESEEEVDEPPMYVPMKQ